jgi:hypothetical protein
MFFAAYCAHMCKFAGTALWINETARAVPDYETVADATDSNVRADDDELFCASVGLKLALY